MNDYLRFMTNRIDLAQAPYDSRSLPISENFVIPISYQTLTCAFTDPKFNFLEKELSSTRPVNPKPSAIGVSFKQEHAPS